MQSIRNLTSNMSVLSTRGVVVLVYYIGLAITSYIAITVIGTDWQKIDSTVHVDVFKCTCLSDTDFQCYQESARTGRSTFDMRCSRTKNPTNYEVCYCGKWTTKKGCSYQCYVIQAHDVPVNCDNEKCSAFDGLQMWMSASKIGVVVGVATSFLLIISMYCVAKRSKQVDISTLWLIHLIAIVPSVTVAFSILTTDVLKQRVYVGLNLWAWTMVIVFGIPLWLVWFFNCVTTVSKEMEYRSRSTNETRV